jgi:hypothetical protein
MENDLASVLLAICSLALGLGSLGMLLYTIHLTKRMEQERRRYEKHFDRWQRDRTFDHRERL